MRLWSAGAFRSASGEPGGPGRGRLWRWWPTMVATVLAGACAMAILLARQWETAVVDVAGEVNRIAKVCATGRMPEPATVDSWLADLRTVPAGLSLSDHASSLAATIHRRKEGDLRVSDFAVEAMVVLSADGKYSAAEGIRRLYFSRGWSTKTGWTYDDYAALRPLLEVLVARNRRQTLEANVIPGMQVTLTHVQDRSWTVAPLGLERQNRITGTFIVDYVDHRDPEISKLALGGMVLAVQPDNVLEVARVLDRM